MERAKILEYGILVLLSQQGPLPFWEPVVTIACGFSYTPESATTDSTLFPCPSRIQGSVCFSGPCVKNQNIRTQCNSSVLTPCQVLKESNIWGIEEGIKDNPAGPNTCPCEPCRNQLTSQKNLSLQRVGNNRADWVGLALQGICETTSTFPSSEKARRPEGHEEHQQSFQTFGTWSFSHMHSLSGCIKKYRVEEGPKCQKVLSRQEQRSRAQHPRNCMLYHLQLLSEVYLHPPQCSMTKLRFSHGWL